MQQAAEWMRTAWLIVISSVLLTCKVLAFVPDNVWLWRYGPRIRAHAEHAGKRVAQVEQTGILSCGICGRTPPRPWYSLRFPNPPFGTARRLPRLRGALRKLGRFVFWTPLLAVLAILAVSLQGDSTANVLVLSVAIQAGVLGVWSMAACVILRLSLGSRDVEHSDLKRFIEFFDRRARHSTARREGLAVYFAALITTSVVCFATTYSGMYFAGPDSFLLDPAAQLGFLDWLHYSLGVVSTSADGSIRPVQAHTKVVVMIQLCSGPLLVIWFISNFLSDD